MPDVVFTENRSGMAQLERQLDRRLGAAVRELGELAQQRVSTPYPPASQPLTPPHMRSGGLHRAIFSRRVALLDWCFGVNSVAADPQRPQANRERLGLWMELGTGTHRTHPVGDGTVSGRPSEIVRSSVMRRPFLIPTLLEDGPRVLQRHLSGGDSGA